MKTERTLGEALLERAMRAQKVLAKATIVARLHEDVMSAAEDRRPGAAGKLLGAVASLHEAVKEREQQ